MFIHLEQQNMNFIAWILQLLMSDLPHFVVSNLLL